MFAYLQSRIHGTASPGPGEPPSGLIAFYWHFVQQTRGWYALMFVTSLAVALIDTVIPVFIGKLVSLMEADDRRAALGEQWPLLAAMVALVLIVRPLVMLMICGIVIQPSSGSSCAVARKSPPKTKVARRANEVSPMTKRSARMTW